MGERCMIIWKWKTYIIYKLNRVLYVDEGDYIVRIDNYHVYRTTKIEK